MNNLVLSDLNAKRLSESLFEVISPQVEKHLTHVLKIEQKEGSMVSIILPGEGRGLAEVNRVKSGELLVSIKELVKTRKRNVHLAIATTRPLMAKRIFEHATTLGAASFNFFKAELSEKSYSDSKVYTNEIARQHIQKGMEQCSQFSSVPSTNIDSNLESVINRFSSKKMKMFWLDANAKNLFSKEATQQEIVLFIGPERGWTKQEIELLNARGIMGIKLSNSVMRVEFAVNAAFSQLEYISASCELR